MVVCRSSLHATAFDDSLLCLQVLAKEGCDLNAADYKGQTPLMLAARHGSCKIIGVPVRHCQSFHAALFLPVWLEGNETAALNQQK